MDKKVTVIGAGNVGATVAQRLVEKELADVVLIDAAWGLGENVVQGAVTPDEYRVFKPGKGPEPRRYCKAERSRPEEPVYQFQGLPEQGQ